MNKKEPFQKGLVPFFGQGRIQGGFKRRWSGVGWLLQSESMGHAQRMRTGSWFAFIIWGMNC